MSSWHNKLGEDGQRLTILSVLPRTPADGTRTDPDGELSLREAIDELFRIAGADGNAQVVLDVRSGEGSGFTTERNVSLQELADRLYGSFGTDGDTRSFLRILGPDDDPFGDSDATSDDDDSRGPLATIRRLREAIHQLYGGSAEEGTPPTVLSLLVGPAAAKPS